MRGCKNEAASKSLDQAVSEGEQVALYRGNRGQPYPNFRKRVIVWPDYAAEAKVPPMPKWEDRGKK